jgi:hypothetical protein
MVLKKIEIFGNDKTAYLPRGWSTVKCKVCNEDELGIIVIQFSSLVNIFLNNSRTTFVMNVEK